MAMARDLINAPANQLGPEELTAAALDVARTVCRRAERRVLDLRQIDPQQNGEIVIYLNRLSDLLWLMARWTETRAGAVAE